MLSRIKNVAIFLHDTRKRFDLRQKERASVSLTEYSDGCRGIATRSTCCFHSLSDISREFVVKKEQCHIQLFK